MAGATRGAAAKTAPGSWQVQYAALELKFAAVFNGHETLEDCL